MKSIKNTFTALVFVMSLGLLMPHFAAAQSESIAKRAPKPIPIYGYKVINRYPHDEKAFTQGLFFDDGYIFESTGFWRQSSIRKVELETGKVVKQQNLPDELFGEGLVRVGNFLVNLTWKSGIALIFDYESFALKSHVRYKGEGWGLTADDDYVYMSDGSPNIRILTKRNLKQQAILHVTAAGNPVTKLNELEWINGEIYANIWETDRLARIDPQTGFVTAWVDLSGLLQNHGIVTDKSSDLNGIAYDPADRRLFVTGKYWSHLFEIRLIPPKP